MGRGLRGLWGGKRGCEAEGWILGAGSGAVRWSGGGFEVCRGAGVEGETRRLSVRWAPPPSTV